MPKAFPGEGYFSETVVAAAKKKMNGSDVLSLDEIVEYFKKQGHIGETEDQTVSMAKDFLAEFCTAGSRAYQYVLAVNANMDLCDFDRWLHVQNVIFGKDKGVLDDATAFGIIDLLYEKDIEILDSPISTK